MMLRVWWSGVSTYMRSGLLGGLVAVGGAEQAAGDGLLLGGRFVGPVGGAVGKEALREAAQFVVALVIHRWLLGCADGVPCRRAQGGQCAKKWRARALGFRDPAPWRSGA